MRLGYKWLVVSVLGVGLIGCTSYLQGDPSDGNPATGVASEECPTPCLEQLAEPQDNKLTDPRMHVEFSSAIPTDLDHGELQKLVKQPISVRRLAEAQRWHDVFSWESFLAINWPGEVVEGKWQSTEQLTDYYSDAPVGESPMPKCRPMATLPFWSSWKEADEIFKEDGSRPAAWNAEDHQDSHILSADNKGITIGGLNGSHNQAFSGPLWDQNGKVVRYQIFVNEMEFDFIVNNELYNLDGQIRYSQGLSPLSFPQGSHGTSNVGVVELKLAWKELGANDDPRRFFCFAAELESGQTVDLGLVGMHIAHKTLTAPEWIWSTFEHVDNVAVDALEPRQAPFDEVGPKPLFNDPTCPTCPVNVLPAGWNEKNASEQASQVFKTQVTRVIPIDMETEALNRDVRARLRDEGSVWQHYQLIGTQWPTVQGASANTDGKLPGAITNRSGGVPTPTYLANVVLETYFQKGNQLAKHLVDPSAQIPEGARAFGTSSCVGCHRDAGIAVGCEVIDGYAKPRFEPASADFSYLLMKRAAWKGGKAPCAPAGSAGSGR